MPLNLQIEPGGEKYLAFAKRKLEQLKEEMKRAKVRALSRWLAVSPSEKIWINSVDVGRGISLDWIRITASDLARGFVVYPSIRRISDDAEYVSPRAMLLNLKGTEISEFSGGPFAVAGPPYRNSRNLVLSTATGGYFDQAKFITKAGLATASFPFLHEYTDANGVAQTRLFAVTPWNNTPAFKDITGDVTALTGSGVLNEVHDVSPDGRKAVAFEGDTRTDYVIDFMSSPQVAEVDTAFTTYGTQIDVVDSAGSIVSGGDPASNSGTFNNTQHNALTTTLSATYPVCYGYSTAGERVSIDIVHASFVSGRKENVLNETNLGDPADDEVTAASGSATYSAQATYTLTLPNGVNREFVISDVAYSLSATLNLVNSVLPNTGSGAGTASRVTGTLEILYADASNSVVVYRYTKDTYVGVTVTVDVSSAAFTFVTPVAASVTREVSVVALVGDEEYEIYSNTSTEVDDGAWPEAPQLVYSGPGGPANGFKIAVGTDTVTSPNVSTTTPSDVTSSPLFPQVKAHQQTQVTGFSVKDAERLVWNYEHGEDEVYVGGVGDPEQALIDWLPGALEADQGTEPTQAEIDAAIQEFADVFTGGSIPALLALLGMTLEELEDLVRSLLTVPPQLTAEQSTQFQSDLASRNLDGYVLQLSTVGIGLI